MSTTFLDLYGIDDFAMEAEGSSESEKKGIGTKIKGAIQGIGARIKKIWNAFVGKVKGVFENIKKKKAEKADAVIAEDDKKLAKAYFDFFKKVMTETSKAAGVFKKLADSKEVKESLKGKIGKLMEEIDQLKGKIDEGVAKFVTRGDSADSALARIRKVLAVDSSTQAKFMEAFNGLKTLEGQIQTSINAAWERASVDEPDNFTVQALAMCGTKLGSLFTKLIASISSVLPSAGASEAK